MVQVAAKPTSPCEPTLPIVFLVVASATQPTVAEAHYSTQAAERRLAELRQRQPGSTYCLLLRQIPASASVATMHSLLANLASLRRDQSLLAAARALITEAGL